MRILFSLLVLFASLGCSWSQVGKGAYEESFNEQYKRNIRMEYIDGRYIPKNLDDAHRILDRIMEADVKSVMKSLPDTIAAVKTVNAIGPYLLKNWNLYEGSRLSHFLKEQKGLHHPLDMTYYILRTYYYHLNDLQFSDEDQLKYLIERRLKIYKESVKDQSLDTIPMTK